MQSSERRVPWLLWGFAGFVALIILLMLISVQAGGPVEQVQGGADFPVPPAPPGAQTPEPASECADPARRISWVDANQYVNRRAALIGPVEEVRGAGDGVQLTVGRPGAEPVLVHILSSALPAGVPPEPFFQNRTICIDGVVQRAGGRLLVVIDKIQDYNLS